MTLLALLSWRLATLWRFCFIILSSINNSRRSIMKLQKGGHLLMRKLSQNQDHSLGCIHLSCERFYYGKYRFLNWYGVRKPVWGHFCVQWATQNSWIFFSVDILKRVDSLKRSGHRLTLLLLLQDKTYCNFLVLVFILLDSNPIWFAPKSYPLGSRSHFCPCSLSSINPTQRFPAISLPNSISFPVICGPK